MTTYKIGSIILKSCKLPECFSAFEIKEENTVADVTFNILEQPFSVKDYLAKYEHDYFEIYKMQDDEWIYEETKSKNKLWVSSDYSQLIFYSITSQNNERSVEILLRLALQCCLVKKGVITLHSACIKKDEKAICFSGKSGTGKSSRAIQWIENLNAEWISGDRPAINVEQGNVYGVPWDGKEQIFKNEEVSLLTIFDVHRSPFTRIRKLTQKQAFAFLVTQLFVPMWDTPLAAQALQLLNRLLTKVQVYSLFCNFLPESAPETYDIIFNNKNKILEATNMIRKKEGFIVRSIAGEYMAMPTGDNIAKFDGTVVLNDVSAFVLRKIEPAVSKEDLLDLILSEYNVEREVAKKDLDMLLQKLSGYGMIEIE